jgi:hypothetical protein
VGPATYLRFPGDDARLDFTDLYVFQSPADAARTVLVIDVNPYTTGISAMPPFLMRSEFHPDGVYRVNIDSNGDAQADAAFTFTWTGQDAFANRNILLIALEVPADMLGPEPEIGVWATVSVRRDGTLSQVDRGGHPTINPFINPDGEKNLFNARQPADDVAHCREPWSKLLADNGYTPGEADAAVRIVLPDILRYDRSRPARYPNGRAITNDAFSARFAWLTNGKVPAQGLKPHDDLLARFPFLGPPNLYAAG